jgi:hypothetical protein
MPATSSTSQVLSTSVGPVVRSTGAALRKISSGPSSHSTRPGADARSLHRAREVGPGRVEGEVGGDEVDARPAWLEAMMESRKHTGSSAPLPVLYAVTFQSSPPEPRTPIVDQ